MCEILLLIAIGMLTFTMVTDTVCRLFKREPEVSNVLFEDDQSVMTLVLDTDSKPYILTEDYQETKVLSPTVEIRDKRTGKVSQFYLEHR